MDDRFRPGSTVERREVLHGHTWLSTRQRVVADDGEVLALWLAEGTELHFPPHPFGPHPWAGATHWSATSVLQLNRAGDGYGVWCFFGSNAPPHWYINFEAPMVRGPHRIETVDHGLDIVINGDRWEWKDRDDVAGQVAAGRLTEAEAAEVWARADRVAADLDAGRRWWDGWHEWRPDPTWPPV